MIKVFPKPLEGTWWAMPSKSMAHRALFASLLANGPTQIIGRLDSDDMLATLQVIRALGATCENQTNGWLVTPPKTWPTSTRPIDFYPDASATTLRYGLCIASTCVKEQCWHPAPGLYTRPLSPLDEVLQGARVNVSKRDALITVSGHLEPQSLMISGSVSSQFIGGLLMALGHKLGTHMLSVTAPFESEAYVEMTIDMMRHFGLRVDRPLRTLFKVTGKVQWESPGIVFVEGDWSNAALPCVLGALQRGNIPMVIAGLNPDSHQGDRAIVPMLECLGAKIRWSNSHSLEIYPSRLKGATFDMRQTPDLLPILAVACAGAEGQSRLINAGRCRLKESDRLESTAALLRQCGIACELTDDSLTIEGVGDKAFCPINTTFESYDDHRLVMATLAASMRIDGPIVIKGEKAMNKSYPTLMDDWLRVGGEFQTFDEE